MRAPLRGYGCQSSRSVAVGRSVGRKGDGVKMGREKVLTTDSGRKKRRSVKAEYVVENGAQFERASAAGEEKSEFHTCSFVRSFGRSLARSFSPFSF